MTTNTTAAEEMERRGARSRAIRPRLDWKWQNDAACKGMPIVAFFGVDGEQRPEREAREARVRKVCLSCPVRQECGDYAVDRPEKFGYWGAMSEDQRASERRRRLRKANAA